MPPTHSKDRKSETFATGCCWQAGGRGCAAKFAAGGDSRASILLASRRTDSGSGTASWKLALLLLWLIGLLAEAAKEQHGQAQEESEEEPDVHPSEDDVGADVMEV
jgi:hypothetical protein